MKVVVDARCLQDPQLVNRGIGRLSLNLIRSAPKFWPADIQLIALTDPRLPPLSGEIRHLFGATSHDAAAGIAADPDAFLELSPMTHDPLYVGKLVGASNLYKAAIVYDFIPWVEPHRYLPTPASRIRYATSVAWLGSYTNWFPISDAVRSELTVHVGAPAGRVHVTSGPVDRRVFEDGASEWRLNRYIATFGGEPRKDVAVAVIAHSTSLEAQRSETHLVIVSCPVGARSDMKRMAESHGGDPSLLYFPGHLDDTELFSLIKAAKVVVVPSRAEGFSMPAAESMAARRPTIVSDIPAHRELIDDESWRFPVGDDRSLTILLDGILSGRLSTEQAVQENYQKAKAYDAETVAAGFWRDFAEGLAASKTPRRVSRRIRRLAVCTPLPPAPSGVAIYSAITLKALAPLVAIDAFSQNNDLGRRAGYSISRQSSLPYLSTNYDNVLSVIGNSSEFHRNIVGNHVRFGSDVIIHDSRMLNYYLETDGMEKVLQLADAELGRSVSQHEVSSWIEDETTLEATFLGEIVEHAGKLIVHSDTLRSVIAERFGAVATRLPFAVQREFPWHDISVDAKLAARRRLGLPENKVLISSFGYVHRSKFPERCIEALGRLRKQGIDAELMFVGRRLPDRGEVNLALDRHNVRDLVYFHDSFLSDAGFVDHLLATDIAVQLRSHGFGSLSAALSDCVAAGIPTIANDDLADAIDAPSYVVRIDDRCSARSVTDGILKALSPEFRDNLTPSRLKYLESHSIDLYAKLLYQRLLE